MDSGSQSHVQPVPSRCSRRGLLPVPLLKHKPPRGERPQALPAARSLPLFAAGIISSPATQAQAPKGREAAGASSSKVPPAVRGGDCFQSRYSSTSPQGERGRRRFQQQGPSRCSRRGLFPVPLLKHKPPRGERPQALPAARSLPLFAAGIISSPATQAQAPKGREAAGASSSKVPPAVRGGDCFQSRYSSTSPQGERGRRRFQQQGPSRCSRRGLLPVPLLKHKPPRGERPQALPAARSLPLFAAGIASSPVTQAQAPKGREAAGASSSKVPPAVRGGDCFQSRYSSTSPQGERGRRRFQQQGPSRCSRRGLLPVPLLKHKPPRGERPQALPAARSLPLFAAGIASSPATQAQAPKGREAAGASSSKVPPAVRGGGYFQSQYSSKLFP